MTRCARRRSRPPKAPCPHARRARRWCGTQRRIVDRRRSIDRRWSGRGSSRRIFVRSPRRSRRPCLRSSSRSSPARASHHRRASAHSASTSRPRWAKERPSGRCRCGDANRVRIELVAVVGAPPEVLHGNGAVLSSLRTLGAGRALGVLGLVAPGTSARPSPSCSRALGSLVYAEDPLPHGSAAQSAAGSPFAGLHFELFLGSDRSPSRLIETDLPTSIDGP